MQQRSPFLPFGADILAKRVLVMLVALSTAGWWITPAKATTRTWTGASSIYWSNPNNWSPAGVPQNGDTLNFSADNDSNRSMFNDLAAFAADSLVFGNGNNSYDYHLDGFSIIVSNAVTTSPSGSSTITITSTLVFPNGGTVKAAPTTIGILTENTATLHLNGAIMVNGGQLTLLAIGDPDGSKLNSLIYVSGTVSGSGDVFAKIDTVVTYTESDDCLIQFDGTSNNTFSGTLYLSTVGASQVVFYKSSGFVVTNRVAAINCLVNGATANLNLAGLDQIGNNATIEVEAGSYLRLSGNSVTVGSLVLTNDSNTVLASTLDTGSTTVGLNGGITASVNNDRVHPIIKGHLNLNGYLPFNISGGPQPGLEIQATMGGNGFNKTGDAILLLSGNNTLFGDVSATVGTIEVTATNAFGQAVPPFGTHINGGYIQLDNVAIGAEPLFVDTPSGFAVLGVNGTCSWAGPVTLNTSLSLVGGDNMDFSGTISGAGGLSQINTGSVLQLDGPTANTFTGPLDVAVGLLKLAKPPGTNAFAGPLIVGNPGAGAAEARWINSYQHVYADVTVYAGSLVNLVTNHEDFQTLTLNGGTVDGGSGELVIYGATTVSPANSTAILNGTLGLAGTYPSNPFIVYDSLALDCDLIVNATIQDGGTLYKQGPGTMCLYGANTYTGMTIVDQGVLLANNANSLGAGLAQTIVNSNATLRLSPAFATLAKPIFLSGDGVSAGAGALAVVNGGSWTLTQGVGLDNPSTISVGTGAGLGINSVLSGNGPLTKTGSGFISLAGSDNNNYTGDTIVSEGFLYLGKAPNKISVPGNLVIGPASAISPAEVIMNQSSGISGAPVVTVNANSLFNLGGNNQVVSQLNLNDGGDVETFAGVLSFPSGFGVDSAVNVGSQVFGSHNSSFIAGHIALPTDGGVTFFVAPYAISGPFDSNPELDISAVVSGPGNLANEGLYKTGQGQMRLSGNNTFAGFAQVNGGTLIAANSGALGTNSGLTFVNNGARLALDGGIAINNEPLYLSSSNAAALDSRSGSNTWSGTITLSQPTGISVSQADGYLEVPNIVSGSGGLTKFGPGVLELRGNAPNSYSGTTTVSEGVLVVDRLNPPAVPGDAVVGDDTTTTTTATLRTLRDQQFGSKASLNVHRSGLFDLFPAPGTLAQTVGTLIGAGAVNLGTGSTLSVSNGAFCAFSGVISGPGAFSKNGTALMQLTGNNTYTGPTTISGGTLQVDGSQSQSVVQVNTSAQLQGLGTVGAVTMSGNSAIVAPGDGPGILTCSNFNASSGGLQIELNGPTAGTEYDQLNVRGLVTFGSKFNLNASLNFTSWISNTFTIINNDGADPVSGIFNGLAEGATLTIGSQQFRISYIGGDGNDVVLTQLTGPPPPPRLFIERVLPASVRLLWPTNDPAFILQSTTNLTTTNWTVVSPVQVISGANNVVTNTIGGTQEYYRLFKP